MSSGKNWRRVVPWGAALAAVACGGAPEPEGGGEAGASAEEVLRQMRATGRVIELPDEAPVEKAVTWYQIFSDSNFSGGLADDDLCVWSGFKGNLDATHSGGNGARLRVINDRWELKRDDHGTVDGDSRAICGPWTNFTKNAGDVVWLGDEAFWKRSNLSSDVRVELNLWHGDAASMISSMEGEWEGFGEKLFIAQSTSPSTPSQLYIRGTNGALFNAHSFGGGAHSVFIGKPGQSGNVPLWGYGPNLSFIRGTVNSSGVFEFPVATDSGFNTYWLSPQDQAICYITNVSGDFNGRGEEIVVRPNNGRWFLEVKAGGIGKTKGASRCMHLNQRRS